jgi:hypothetical protein
MFMRTLSPLEAQRSYRARNSAVVEAVELADAAGGEGLEHKPLRTKSAQEGELDPIPVFFRGAGCCRVDPAGKAAPRSLPVDGGAERHGARLGVAGKTAVPSCTASPLSGPKEGEVRWRGVRLGVAENVDRPKGS